MLYGVPNAVPVCQATCHYIQAYKLCKLFVETRRGTLEAYGVSGVQPGQEIIDAHGYIRATRRQGHENSLGYTRIEVA